MIWPRVIDVLVLVPPDKERRQARRWRKGPRPVLARVGGMGARAVLIEVRSASGHATRDSGREVKDVRSRVGC